MIRRQVAIPTDQKKISCILASPPWSTNQIDWSARISTMVDALAVADGGFSVNPHDGSDVRTGYAVAIHPEHEYVFDTRVTSYDLHEYVAQAKDALSLPGRVLGGWRDPVTGRVYLDISIVIADLSEAMTLARRTRQLAIFDFSAMESVPVNSRGMNDEEEQYARRPRPDWGVWGNEVACDVAL